MIQRIQSVYLALGAVAIVALLLVDAVWSGPAAVEFAWFSPVLLILGAVIIIGAIGAIFLYKDRRKQRKVVVAVQTMTLVFVAVLYLGLFLAEALDFSAVGIVMTILLPILAYVLFYFARRGVERDINLVRSMDRLR